uniref:Tetraspanin-9-like n=1 Tax=Dermatophagoides pteronyssinus TaxID=6956 RepID=A0A6P6Y993_DERPT|nr:tetraspanin-9-like [Dermatophagoides pteronyssinus]
MKIILFLIRLIVGAIGINTWIFGCCMMFYVVWSLNTINNIQSFSFGNALITNSQLIFGLLLSTVGLLIIYSSWKKNCHTLKLCIFLTVLIISMEIGTFISAKVANIQISNLVDQGWKEINIQSRNFIQKELKCCGLTGLSEFASKLDPIDQSCYREQSLSTSTSSIEYDNHPITIYEPYRIGCKQKLIDWLRKQRKTFIISICSLLAVQIISIILMLILLKLLQNDLFKQQRRRLQSNNMIIIGGSCVGDDESPTSSTSPSSLIFNNGKNKQILLDDI